MSKSDQESLHGHVGTGLGGYSRLLDPDPNQPTELELRDLAAVNRMGDRPDLPSDHPDPEENLYVPAGYTYFGQFVDHDVTFDTTSTLDITDSTRFTNLRTPSFDLDNLYGLGPDAAPYMYQDGIKLVEGVNDLPRQAGRAIIGDPRNDENSIICNMQMAFIRFHNAVVDRLVAKEPNLKGTRALFHKARNEVRWTYQRILVDDFLPRIVSNETLSAFEVRRDPNPMGLTRNESAYAVFTADKRGAMPLEFTGAAYRFGHSMVRTAYRLNGNFQALIFAAPDTPQALSLVGFQPLPPEHVISDWSILLPDPAGSSKSKDPGQKDEKNDVDGPGAGNPKRLQFGYRIDTTFVNPLAFLPQSVAGGPEVNLGARNLLRGRKFQLASGQAAGDALGVPILDPKYLVYRDKVSVPGQQTFTQIPLNLVSKTPLWFYILAEAQMPMVDWWLSLPRGKDNKPPAFMEADLLAAASQTATQLGETGGRIVLEVFHGLLDADPQSYRNHRDAARWTPLIKDFRLWNVVNCVFAQP